MRKRLLASLAFSAAAVLAACATGTAAPVDAGPTCGVGSQLCGDTCATLDRDPANCGACGKACNTGEVCSAGKCEFACGTGTSLCSGLCVNEQADPGNCGTCGNKCGQGQVCSAGKCAPTCAQGTTACGAACVDTNVDRANCGGCGNPCAAGEECASGTCQLQCQAGLLLCPNDYGDGGAGDASVSDGGDGGGLGPQVCVDPWVDRYNCGACGAVCPASKPLCRFGQCQSSCGATKCQTGTDVTNSSLQWVVCQADCSTAWVSSVGSNGGQYHAAYICKQLGYNNLGAHGGNCGDVCGYCSSGTSCNNLGPMTFDNGGTSCGSDSYGQILCDTVMWQCTM